MGLMGSQGSCVSELMKHVGAHGVHVGGSGVSWGLRAHGAHEAQVSHGGVPEIVN